jgi:hypothetical protein
LGSILGKSNIQPTTNNETFLYDFDEIKLAIESHLNVKPTLLCYVLRESGLQYLSQIEICLSKKLTLVDCVIDPDETVLPASGNIPEEIECRADMPIHYPAIKYS